MLLGDDSRIKLIDDDANDKGKVLNQKINDCEQGDKTVMTRKLKIPSNNAQYDQQIQDLDAKDNQT